MNEYNEKVCIIGAGPAGLAAARNLKVRGIDYDHFERHSGVGGIWDIENRGTPMYASAHFISSRTKAAYYGFPLPADYPDYPGHKLILDYVRSFAEHYGLIDQVIFGTGIESIEHDGSSWTVKTQHGAQARYSHVICASGHTWEPNWPDYPGEFAGKIIHSVDYRTADLFKDKRVLIVGAGNSACDIACDAAQSADQAYISMRRGYHFIPKHVSGVPTDVYADKTRWIPLPIRRWGFERKLKQVHGDLTQYGLQAPDHRVLESHPIINSQLIHYLQHGDIAVCRDIDRFDGNHVVFKDGRSVEVDLIVYATGYEYSIPYADQALFDWNGYKPSLAYSVFNRRHETLFAVGFTEMNAGGYYIFDEMTSLIADAIETKTRYAHRWPEAKRLITQPTDFSGGLNFVASERHADYLDMDTYLKACQKLASRLGWKSARALLDGPQPAPEAFSDTETYTAAAARG